MGKIFNQIDKQIIRPKVNKAYKQGFKATENNMQDFYSQGSPKIYSRTGQYGDSPRGSGVSGGNGEYNYWIMLEEPVYSTGTPGFPVLDEAEVGGSGILGKPGRWEQSEQDIENAIIDNFS